MDQVREAFLKVRQDMDFLFNELNLLKISMEEIKISIANLSLKISKSEQKEQSKLSTPADLSVGYTPTHNLSVPSIPTYNPTYNNPLKALKPQILGISTGNEGVPTDKQTDKQTDNRHIILKEKPLENPITDAAKILDSLDNLKREIRLKFKRLTEQEILVFSTLYQLDNEQGYADYKSLAKRLNLTESSIRDYIGRLILKGIPIDKTKLNNKKIQLKISESLKKVVSLSTILQLRDL